MPIYQGAQMSKNASKFTVYYVVGQPRSGSTFVGDWIARDRRILNAGEVWQTFRSLGFVSDAGFEKSGGRWARPEERERKNEEIRSDSFWSLVISEIDLAPYESLIRQAKIIGNGMVDCSKTDKGIERYLALGCEVVVIHTQRSFSTWATSMQGYNQRHQLPYVSRWRLLLAYLRVNLRHRRWTTKLPYFHVKQERLDNLDSDLDLVFAPRGAKQGYVRAEMFGTPNFIGSFDARRATSKTAPGDRLLYKMTLAGS